LVEVMQLFSLSYICAIRPSCDLFGLQTFQIEFDMSYM
jgi:hypothetical protein